MGKKYTTQPFKIELSYDTLPENTESASIKYINPRGQRGTFAATLDTEKKCVVYESAAGEHLKFAGIWKFWSVFHVSGNESFPGESIQERIYVEGD